MLADRPWQRGRLGHFSNGFPLQETVAQAITVAEVQRSLLQDLIAKDGCLQIALGQHALNLDLISRAMPTVLPQIRKVQVTAVATPSDDVENFLCDAIEQSPNLTAVEWIEGAFLVLNQRFMARLIRAIAVAKSQYLRRIAMVGHSSTLWTKTEEEECENIGLSSLAGLKSLRELELRRVCFRTRATICRALMGHQFLESVTLDWGGYVHPNDENIQVFLDSLPRLRKLYGTNSFTPRFKDNLVHLEADAIRRSDLVHFAKDLRGARQLRDLRLSVSFRLPTPHTLYAVLPRLPLLETLHASVFDVDMLLQCRSLKHLTLSHASLVEIGKLLTHHPTLESFDYRHNLREDEASYLFEVTEKLPQGNLQDLRLMGPVGQAAEDHDVVHRFKQTLQVNQKITALKLQDAPFLISVLPTLLESNLCFLKHLSLHSCVVDVSVEHIVAVIRALPLNSTLESLSVSTNSRGIRRVSETYNACWDALIETIPGIQHLRKLKVFDTLRAPVNNDDLADALQKNISLTKLTIGGNDITQMVCKFFVRRNRILRMIQDDELPDAIWPLALSSLASNPSALFLAARQVPWSTCMKRLLVPKDMLAHLSKKRKSAKDYDTTDKATTQSY